MCTDCTHHVAALQYLSSHHDPKIGFKNFSLMKQLFGEDQYNAICATVSISVNHAAADSETQNSASVPNDIVQIWQASSQQRSYIQPYMAVNDTEIGKTAVPGELVKVTYLGRSVYVQIMYDEGSQITLVNPYCEPLIMNTRYTEKAVKLSGIGGESFEVRKILKLYLRHNIQIEGILVPSLPFNPTTVKRPICLKDYDKHWALPFDQHFSGQIVAKILMGTDCTQFLPVTVTTPEGIPIQTSKARLKRSLITGKYLLFGSAEEKDQLITSEFPCEPTAEVNALDCMTEEEQIDFRHSDLQDDVFLSSKIEMIDIGTDSEEDQKDRNRD